MELGEKIRQARLEKGLSQRQLCGQEITRNMLSQIENGSARPSMDTLRFLAGQLEKPMSWFLEEPAQDQPNYRVMTQLREAWSAGAYEQVLQLLDGYRSPDEDHDRERYLLEALSLMGEAARLAGEKPVYAQKLLEQAAEAGAKTPYFTQSHRREWALRMGQVSGRATPVVSQLQADDRELLLRAKAAMEAENWRRAATLLAATENRDEQWYLLAGGAAMGQKDYARAAEHYRKAESRYPRSCAKALEICYRELEDFKMADYYACKQREK